MEGPATESRSGGLAPWVLLPIASLGCVFAAVRLGIGALLGTGLFVYPGFTMLALVNSGALC